MKSLPNEIILKIIQRTTLRDINKLKNVNKFFKTFFNFYRKDIIKIIYKKKWFQNLKYTRLYMLYDHKEYDIFNVLKKLITLTEPYNYIYDFSNFHKNKTLDKCIVPSQLYKLDHNKEMPKFGDIISSFIIKGKDITKIELMFGSLCVKRCHYIKANLINFKPFDFGINMLCLSFSDVRLKITGTVDYVIGKYLFLHIEDRKLLIQNIYDFDSIFYDNKNLYTKLRLHGNNWNIY